MRHFSSLKANDGFYFITFSQKLLCMINASIKVVLFNAAGKLNFFNLNYYLLLLCLFFSFVTLKAELSVIDSAAYRRCGIRNYKNKVNTVVTPGATVDVVVTDQGVAVNPNRPEVAEKLKAAGIKVFTIEQLKAKAEAIVGKPEPIRYKDNIVGVVMYRDNTVIDVIRQIEE